MMKAANIFTSQFTGRHATRLSTLATHQLQVFSQGMIADQSQNFPARALHFSS